MALSYEHAYPIRIEVKGQLPTAAYTVSEGTSVVDSFAPFNLALGAKADSPESIPEQGPGHAAGAIDGNHDSYWDDEDGHSE